MASNVEVVSKNIWTSVADASGTYVLTSEQDFVYRLGTEAPTGVTTGHYVVKNTNEKVTVGEGEELFVFNAIREFELKVTLEPPVSLGEIEVGEIEIEKEAVPASNLTNALAVQIVDADGNQIVDFGGEISGDVTLSQYTPVSGRLPVDGSGVTQPVSGTVTANIGTIAGVATAANQVTQNNNLTEIAENTRLFRPVDGLTLSPTDTTSDESVELPGGRIWVKGNVDFHIEIGESPTATITSSPPLTAMSDYYFYTDENDIVSVITAGEASGTVWLSAENPI